MIDFGTICNLITHNLQYHLQINDKKKKQKYKFIARK